MERSNGTTSIAATTASSGTASSQAAPHRKNAAQRNRSDSPYQGRTAQKDNPTQLIIKQAVDFLIRQVEAGKSETLAAYLTAMARFSMFPRKSRTITTLSLPHLAFLLFSTATAVCAFVAARYYYFSSRQMPKMTEPPVASIDDTQLKTIWKHRRMPTTFEML
jgi:hypothetical protein